MFRELTAHVHTHTQGPLSEEVVFRSCIIATSALTGKESITQLILLSPLYFGLAHVHHAFEIWINYGKTKQAALTGLLTSSAFAFSLSILPNAVLLTE